MQLVGNKSAEQIDPEVHWTTVPGMLDLLLILQLVVDGLDDASSSEHQFVHEREQSVLHVPLDARDELGSLPPECRKQILGDIPSVTEKFAMEPFGQLGHGLDVVIRHIAWRNEEGYQFTVLIHDEMQFESIEPAHAAFTSGSESFEDFVSSYSPVVTDRQLG